MVTNNQAAENARKIARKGKTSEARKALDTSTSTATPTGNATAAEKSPFIFTMKDVREYSNEEADKAIARVSSEGIKYKKEVHRAAIGIVLHWQKHGDDTRLQKLRVAIEAGMSRIMGAGFVKWVTFYTSLTYNDEAKKFVHTPKTNREFNLTGDRQATDDKAKVGALNTPFFSASFGDRAPFSFDFDAFMQTALRRMEVALQRVKDGKAEVQNVKNLDEKKIKDFKRFMTSHGIALTQLEAESSVAEKDLTLHDGTVAKGDKPAPAKAEKGERAKRNTRAARKVEPAATAETKPATGENAEQPEQQPGASQQAS